MDQAEKRTRQENPIKLGELNMTPILVAMIVGFIAVAIFVILRKKSSTRRDLVLTGINEAGKSSIYMRVLHGKFPETFTSMKENVGDYKIGGLAGRVVDIPGHYRVREKCFDQYKKTAKGIVFVLDSVTIQKDIRDVADALYTILTDSTTLPCSFLVLCNKQDLTTAKSVQVVKTSLEKELNIVRDTRSRKLQSVGDDENTKPVYLGKPGKDFEWSHLQQNIQFYECSAKDGELLNLTEWISRLL